MDNLPYDKRSCFWLECLAKQRTWQHFCMFIDKYW